MVDFFFYEIEFQFIFCLIPYYSYLFDGETMKEEEEKN